MATVDLIDLVEQRVNDIGEDGGLETEAAYFMGELGPWSFMMIQTDDEIIGFEFLETEDSWRRPGAIEEYNVAANYELDVLVIVPEKSFVEATEMIYRSGGVGITISNYHAMELSPRPLVS
ncbi:MAG: hypothetical protein GX369_03930 [Euryarchaeota archaeon]|nr:hypothetical protein [Euryarchaeota archaeon]